MSHTDRTVTPRKHHKVGLRGDGQIQFVRCVRNTDVTIAYGPAGSGKTFLAVACALEALLKQQVSRIVLTRPAVEAGEKLGYLPGDFETKVQPYLQPLLDALHHLHPDASGMREAGVIEVSPLAYMRGRTFNDTFMVLDEAQNTTPVQMQMYLTRMGNGSKNVVVGDPSQVDIDGSNGLTDAINRFEEAKHIQTTQLRIADIQRHPAVEEIVRRYAEID